VTIKSLFDLSGKVALVTGGSRGLGKEMVLAFAEQGADVVIASRKLENCRAVAAEVRDRFDRRAFPYACHVGHWDEVDRLAETAYEEFGKVDILVNNAGLSPLYGDRISNVTEDLWRKVLDVNLTGPFRLTALVGERMVADGGGAILNISTTGAVVSGVSPISLPYHAAKGGLNIITMGFAKAFAPSVRVNCIMPGGFLTDVSAAWATEDGRTDHVPLGRFGRPEEIVGAALFFVSEASSYATGAILPVAGGPQ
jgi:NAD(P)-dependent dehydrogenase (short-subunit alcohol dehydrogenase family)